MPHTISALTIAGSDPCAGAGLQADLKTFSALGVYGCSVVSALTAQNTTGVEKIWCVPVGSVEKQINVLLDDITVSAIKFGMLNNAQVIQEVSHALLDYPEIPIVCDPVIVSSSGKQLLDRNGIGELKEFIKEHKRRKIILTPNINEAAILLNEDAAENESDMIKQAEKLLGLGCAAVVLTGGDLDQTTGNIKKNSDEQSVDVFVSRENNVQTCEVFRVEKISTKNTHGTGCTFSAALASGLAKKMSLGDSVAMAKEYITHAIAHADELEIGHGAGPLQHFYQ
ncbi:MAG: bifunctional hydroxymethylpyrimidine kinase/phosphomethylpyrimidine kinase [Cellvibrionaceae bacterium]